MVLQYSAIAYVGVLQHHRRLLFGLGAGRVEARFGAFEPFLTALGQSLATFPQSQ